ncbi:hypothetical protein ACFFX0_05525 [Citricoccus parietis]|uniref:Uncharacterized protein n=1 Tax=Citricoccus parietis TaxID=592307 RepID=A0ABV5FVJ2_9MICC
MADPARDEKTHGRGDDHGRQPTNRHGKQAHVTEDVIQLENGPRCPAVSLPEEFVDVHRRPEEQGRRCDDRQGDHQDDGLHEE